MERRREREEREDGERDGEGAGERDMGKVRTTKRGIKNSMLVWEEFKIIGQREETWLQSKKIATAGVQALLEKRKGSRPLYNYYYIIKSNNSNSLGEVTAHIVIGI